MDYKEFQTKINSRPIARDELVLDCDNKQGLGELGIMRICQVLAFEGYRIEIYKAEGQKSPHAHIKDIPHIADLTKEQNKLYKELLIKKYISKVRELIEAPEMDEIDFSLCIPDHLVAEENKPHFKYKTEKKLIAVINEGHANFCEQEIWQQAVTYQKPTYAPNPKGSGITSKIVQKLDIRDIARKFGLSLYGDKCLCPFHADSKTPSLVFYPAQGRFHCFGCNEDGNIIKFYALMKRLKSQEVSSA